MVITFKKKNVETDNYDFFLFDETIILQSRIFDEKIKYSSP